jgi:hypothetical protein
MTRKQSDQDRAKGAASGLQPIALPSPALAGRGTLVAALRRRRTIREIGATPLPLQTLSDLLWAACGVNRKLGPFGMSGRTAGSASNSQEIDLYVVLKEGTYLYDALVNRLTPVVAGDLRPLAIGNGQGGGESAPVRLVYVADIDKLANTSGFAEPGLRDPDIQHSYYFAQTVGYPANKPGERS